MSAWIGWIVAAGLAAGVAGARAADPAPEKEKEKEADAKPVRILMDLDAEAGEGEKPPGAECAGKCRELGKTPGRVEECCGKFNACHDGGGRGASVACHIPKKCCAESFAKTGRHKCEKCAPVRRRPVQAEETKPLGKPDQAPAK